MENIEIFLAKNQNKRVSSIGFEIENFVRELNHNHSCDIGKLKIELAAADKVIKNYSDEKIRLDQRIFDMEKRLDEIKNILDRFLPVPNDAMMQCTHCGGEQSFLKK